jgi:ElaB/YqjD/DUF883 family membrane-anchored ribosome-binding protein
MDEQNKGVNERWAPPGTTPERGYTREEPATPVTGTTGARTEERSPGEIRAEIERTRADMGETIDEIQDRLRPGNVAARVTESVREATVGKMREMAHSAQDALTGRGNAWDDYGDDESYGLIDRIRDHPVPFTLATVSIAWLAFAGRGHRRPSDRAIYGSTAYGEPYIRETRMRDDRSRSYYGSAGARGDTGEPTVGRTMHDAAEGLRHAAGDVRHTASEATSRMGEVTRETGYEVRRRARRTTNQLERMVRDNPLMVGAIAAAVGAAVGLIVPETQREHELMGDARDQLFEKAKETATEAKERVEQAAVRAQDAAQKAATETLTGGDKTDRS